MKAIILFIVLTVPALGQSLEISANFNDNVNGFNAVFSAEVNTGLSITAAYGVNKYRQDKLYPVLLGIRYNPGFVYAGAESGIMIYRYKMQTKPLFRLNTGILIPVTDNRVRIKAGAYVNLLPGFSNIGFELGIQLWREK